MIFDPKPKPVWKTLNQIQKNPDLTRKIQSDTSNKETRANPTRYKLGIGRAK